MTFHPDPSAPIEAPAQEPVLHTTSRWAKRSPEQVAIAWTGGDITYRQLHAGATRIAAALIARGVNSGARVVVTGPRAPSIVEALLGVWACGGVIVPVAENLPAERKRIMAHESAASVCVSCGAEPVDYGVPILDVAMDADIAELAAGASGFRSCDDAYIFFTSGTTGIPKGVLGTHQGLAHFLRWQRESFAITETDRAAQLTGLSFDVVLRDLLAPLCAGATLCFPPAEAETLDPLVLYEWLRHERISVMHSVPSVLEARLTDWRDEPPLTSLRLLFMAGEPLSDTLVRAARGKFPQCRIVNLYGPTETTLAKCFYEVPAEPSPGTQPVGEPIPNTQALVVNDAGLLCGPGESGEIVIRTPFRTRGYLREDGAGSRFHRNPWRDDPADLVYYTGDRGRRRLGGEIDILGRVDDQVKILGVRVQPAEVAAVLRTHPSVSTCFVKAFTDAHERTGLCGYVVLAPGMRAQVGDLRNYLAEKLPTAMVPSAFVLLETMPLTENGKVDRKALPAPQAPVASAGYVGPRSATEQMVADTYAEVLEVPRVGVNDSFLELGGHSLLATRLVARLRKLAGIALPVRSVFGRTVAEVAADVEHEVAGPRAEDGPIQPTAREGPLPLSFAEEGLWFVDQYAPGRPTYNLPHAMRLRGLLDERALREALDALARRHESLRTRFVATRGDGPTRIVDPPAPVAFERLTLEHVAGADPVVEARRWAEREALVPFDLSAGPLFRAALLEVDRADHFLVLTVHHIVSDDWSMGVIIRDLAELYASAREVRSAMLPALPIQYADYAAWERRTLTNVVLEGALEYWKAKLAGVATLELPADWPRPPTQSTEGARHAFHIDERVAQRLRALAQREGCTLFMLFLSAVEVLLSRYSGQDDFAVGTPAAHRTRLETEGLVGLFVNSVPLRVDVLGNPTMRELLARVRSTVLDALAHQELPFERLVQELRPLRDPSRTSLFQVMFALQSSSSAANAWPGLDAMPFSLDRYTAKFDLTIFVEEHGTSLRCAFEYATALFDAATIERMATHLRVLLEAVTSTQDARVGLLPMLTGAERHQLIVTWNATETTYRPETTTHELFEEQAKKTPNAVAVTFRAQSVTYGALNSRANQLARVLVERGVGLGVLVGVCLERSVGMVVALLGVLKAGGGYVPLDPSYPKGRLEFILADTRAPIVITQEHLGARLGAYSGHRLLLDAGADDLAAHGTANLARRATPDSLAYVIYTSGSTGLPKGVAIPQRGLSNYLAWAAASYAASTGDSPVHTSFGFDLTITSLLLPLISGRAAALCDEGPAIAGLATAIRSRGVFAFIKLTPSHLPALAEVLTHAELATVGHCLVIGGEALTSAHVDAFRSHAPGTRIVNEYGPTETVVGCSTYEPLSHDQRANIPIGRPIANMQLHVLDPNLEPVPVGVAGELDIGGIQLARGYLNRPDLTAERFIPNLFGKPGSRLYRTGDQARYRSDGNIDFLGRVDHQLKVRGFRIEPGEIESVLEGESNVRECVVVARDDGSGGKRLVAYVVPANLDPLRLRAALQALLPEYMVPTAFVGLERLPLTPNGKVDRRALPAPDMSDQQVGYVAPRNPIEEALCAIWASLLKVARVGVHDNFFELGGHSLLAMRVVARIRERFAVGLPVSALFDHPKLGELSIVLEKRLAAPASVAPPPPARARRDGRMPLSFTEARLWFLDQFEPGRPTYNVEEALRLRGILERRALARSLDALASRHESLRTRFVEDSGQPARVIDPPSAIQVEEISLKGVDEGGREAEARRRAAREARRPFDLSMGPLFRVVLLELGDTDHVLLLAMHHIVTDGWSMGVLIRELSELYSAARQERPAILPELPVAYADYALWQSEWLRGDRLEQLLAYWRNCLTGVGVLELPTDRSRPAVQSTDGATLRFLLDARVTRELQVLADRWGGTLFMVLLAGLEVLLARYAGQRDFAVGTPVAYRTRVETEGIVGFFVNTLALRANLASDPTGIELLARVRETTLSAFAHQDMPFERLVEELHPVRDPSRTPLFQVMFALQNAPAAPAALAGLRAEPFETDLGVSKCDLALFAQERDRDLRCSLQYATALFDATAVERMAEHFGVVLEGMVSAPERDVWDLPLLTEGERRCVLWGWNSTEVEYGATPFVYRRFEEQAARAPDAVALVFESTCWTYRELNARANQLARLLRKLGVIPDVLVGVCLERSVELVVALLAVLKAGGAYVPLDPAYPPKRLRFMAAAASLHVLLTQSRLSEPPSWSVPRVVYLDGERSEWSEEAVHDLAVEGLSPEHLLCAIYTSGSTGQPKGVLSTHRGICNRLLWMQQAFGLDASDAVLQKTPFSFDVSVWEFFWPLMCGAKLVVAVPGGHRDPAYLVELIQSERVTTAHFVPPMLQAFLDEPGVTGCTSLRRILCSGEELPYPLKERFFEVLGAELDNLYGPTEASIDVSWWRACAGGSRKTVPIGRPIANTQLYVLDSRLEPVPVGVSGDLYIGGVQLARGYLQNPELTAERFVPDPFGPQAGNRVYRTGDLARWTVGGDVEFLGRSDRQVKVRGFRIELTEIELALEGESGVRECVVAARDYGTSGKRLVAYVVPANVDLSRLQTAVRAKLPDYMVPTALVGLDALPLTLSGKVDWKALPAPDFGVASANSTAQRTPLEQIIADIWVDILRVEQVHVEDNFFELGGHSLLATQLAARLRKLLGVELPLRALFERPTVASLAAEVQERLAGPPVEDRPIERIARDGPMPLSFAEARLWFLEQYLPGTATYNVSQALRVHGSLDRAALEGALRELVARHESLRTRFVAAGGEPLRVIDPSGQVSLEYVEMEDVAEADLEEAARRQLEARAHAPFDLATGPLFRATLARLAPDNHLLLLSMHHIVTDAWSTGILMRELLMLYEAFARGEPSPLVELSLRYADYAAWQRAPWHDEKLRQQLLYWKKHLAGVLTAELPTDRPRPPVQSTAGATHAFELDAALSAKLKALSRQEGTTLFMTLLSGFGVLLARYTGQNDFTVGTPIAGRTRVELESLVGLFLNTLALRLDLTGPPRMRQLLSRARDETLAAYAHQDVPFERLVEELAPTRDFSHSPLFQVLFTLQNAPSAPSSLMGLELTPLEVASEVSAFDLFLLLEERVGVLWGTFEYAVALFDGATIQRMAEHFRLLLEATVANPDQRAADLSLLTVKERSQLIFEWSGHEVARPMMRASRLFERWALAASTNVAVISDALSFTYGQVNRRANQLAARLVRLGIKRGDTVALLMRRSVEAVVGILGILKAGAAYLPVDPALPSERRQWMIDRGAARVVVTVTALKGAARTEVVLDRPGELAGELETDLAIDASIDDGLAVLFTSGSTGEPKAVLLPHRGLVNYALCVADSWKVTARDRILQFASLGFDTSLEEILTAWAAGAALVLRDDAMLDPKVLLDACDRYGVTVLDLPTAYYAIVLELITEGEGRWPQALRLVCIGGERAHAESIESFYRSQDHPARLVNTYGPTEASISATWCETGEYVDHGRLRYGSPIGRVVPNCRLYILDPYVSLVPMGVVGEICIGGIALAHGYIGEAALTADAFVPNPFACGERIYRTGDFARFRPDGTLEFVGRRDDQIKIRGFRIELGEVEAVLSKQPGVRQCAVVAHEDRAGKRLVAYASPKALDARGLLAALKARLPDYMVPSTVILLEELPLTSNGKLDRKGLPMPRAFQMANEYLPPRNEVERELCAIWQELLGVARVGVDEDFFALGGHSLAVVKLVAAVRERLGRPITVSSVFAHPTVASLTVALQSRAEAGPSTLMRLRDGSPGAPAIVCIAPIGGDISGYRELVPALQTRGHVFALRAVGSDGGEPPLETVEGIAADHTATLRRSHAGPYVLVGWSFGGIVAFEVAKQLEAAGVQVGDVIAVDAYPATESAPRSEAELLVDYVVDLARTKGGTVPAISRARSVNAIWEQLVSSGFASATEVDVLRQRFGVYRANILADTRYVPGRAPLRVRWLRASDVGDAPLRMVEVARARWVAAAQGGLVEATVEGDHYSVMRGPSAAVVAHLVDEATGSALGRGD